MITRYKYLAIAIGLFCCFPHDVAAQDGAAIFKQNCGACHMLGQRLVGPDLIGVNERRSQDWLLKFIKSSQSVIKSGDPDASDLFAKFNQTIMPDQSQLGDDQIKSILAYISEETQARQVVVSAVEPPGEAVPAPPIEYSDLDIAEGRLLFLGNKSLSQGGPACISCHNINNNDLVSGGLLAKDLTNVYTRLGDAGIAGILGAPPFPPMTTAYTNKALDSLEIVELTAFLKHADDISPDQEVKTGANIFLVGGTSGLILLLLLISFIWRKRLRKSVKQDIYQRQIKSV
ncbi:MAG: cytochrome c [Flavobacteriales bacterium]|nr:cytochrome c [Flavobacteriales bacterium]MCB9447318.1 cytochrome c [Flavobacteriales bacterium]